VRLGVGTRGKCKISPRGKPPASNATEAGTRKTALRGGKRGKTDVRGKRRARVKHGKRTPRCRGSAAAFMGDNRGEPDEGNLLLTGGGDKRVGGSGPKFDSRN